MTGRDVADEAILMALKKQLFLSVKARHMSMYSRIHDSSTIDELDEICLESSLLRASQSESY
jgi:hypothetical protein